MVMGGQGENKVDGEVRVLSEGRRGGEFEARFLFALRASPSHSLLSFCPSPSIPSPSLALTLDQFSPAPISTMPRGGHGLVMGWSLGGWFGHRLFMGHGLVMGWSGVALCWSSVGWSWVVVGHGLVMGWSWVGHGSVLLVMGSSWVGRGLVMRWSLLVMPCSCVGRGLFMRWSWVVLVLVSVGQT